MLSRICIKCGPAWMWCRVISQPANWRPVDKRSVRNVLSENCNMGFTISLYDGGGYDMNRALKEKVDLGDGTVVLVNVICRCVCCC